MKQYNVMTAMLMVLVLGWSQPSYGHTCSAACGCPDMHTGARHNDSGPAYGPVSGRASGSGTAPASGAHSGHMGYNEHSGHTRQAATAQQQHSAHGHGPEDALYIYSSTLQPASDHHAPSPEHADATQAGTHAAVHDHGVTAHAGPASSYTHNNSPNHASEALGDFQLTYANLAELVHTHTAQQADDTEYAPATPRSAEPPCTMSVCAPAFTPMLTHAFVAPLRMAEARSLTVHSDDVIPSMHTADLFRPPRA